MQKPLVVIVPTRSRPENVPKVLEAWKETRAFQGADLVFAYDDDDPKQLEYSKAIIGSDAGWYRIFHWMPMVAKLNQVALAHAHYPWVEAVGFAGDDHLPRTVGWTEIYLHHLREQGTGIVYGNDLYQGHRLPTEWAMTANIIRSLGRIVPAHVDHLYSDSSVLDLGVAAECIRYLPQVTIEHVHPIVKKADWDEQYQTVNSRAQYAKDSAIYKKWKQEQLARDAEIVRQLKGKQ